MKKGQPFIIEASPSARREDDWKGANDELMKSHLQNFLINDINLFNCFAKRYVYLEIISNQRELPRKLLLKK